jgi:hypothetical protein
MAVTINASTVSGLIQTADTSGVINLQSGGTTVAAVSSTGLAVTGTLTVNGASPGRSGASYATLSSGTPNITLTASSNQLQIITATAEGQSITLPDATTMTLGSGYFVFYNTSTFGIAIKDTGGTVREFLYPAATGSPIQAVSLSLQENATANGVWHIQNPISAASTTTNNFLTSSPSLSGTTFLSLLQVNGTQFIALSNDYNVSNGAVYAKLVTVNTSTGALTFGSSVTLSTGLGANNFPTGLSGDSNGSDRGVICLSMTNSNQNVAVSNRIWGFAIVAGTLYVSSSITTITLPANGLMVANISARYVSNNCFFLWGSLNSQNSAAGNYVNGNVTGVSVGVASTTVSLTTSTGATSFTNQAYNTFYYCSPTSQSTFVVDWSGGTVPRYVSYNTSTNTLTTGTRTSQTTIIAGTLLANMATPNGTVDLIANNTNQLLYYGYSVTVANAGTATVTVTANANYNYKSFAAKSYSSTTGVIGNIASYVVSANSYYTIDTTNNKLLVADPPNNNFNFASASFGGTTPYWLSSTQILFLNSSATTTSSISTQLVSPAIPFVS